MDFTPGAAHRQTLRTHEDYMLGCARIGSQPSTMFLCPGVTLDMIAIDSMHTIDLGVTSHILGNTLFEIIFEQRPHGWTIKKQVAHVWARIQDIYKEQNTKYRISFDCLRSRRNPHPLLPPSFL